MILSDRDIKARLEKGDLVVDPITDWDLQLQPASLDVRLGTEFAISNHICRVSIRETKKILMQSRCRLSFRVSPLFCRVRARAYRRVYQNSFRSCRARRRA